ncbi:MAG: hypothetical protein A2268_10765 [Candidatus Raymondbacteria bacterium RifOxyA12_full_50_37]|uniref:Uncharacterized protein n=1 Tax=Candidatus Raymondbacteria bacterium RIFOXYD12_FULL_49_13 TaxID=1817890 RepID=A0A1F7F8T2_UNCRA|nr:MAG: hypothetical protein A2268_10765 [Candidatus Raymondbacteria bacterium RifOxyA12_full_50_37]OGJ85444.1 MAG: hypothetical protein A2248_12550 [Candidatus Raymondbacteria bacterium RIFOXYA2_FULL_49_16]OGJ91037.1 MAG: hypothetical protein A2350_07360 [Candidatus Raymondbacteria bacterium RifOxyB12_full_50_8]OGJ94952.1 MAG: hypothetical protein A2453_08020 [Candidatus Raymondbacteria bacterium RIFOXYC2_FULL_50_21]OGK02821.1 MAG: hypothetical protein A2487_16175 [Candidatus Raymondbacteria b
MIGASKTLAAQALAKVKSELAQDRYFPDRPTGGEKKVSEILDRSFIYATRLRYAPKINFERTINRSFSRPPVQRKS